MKKPIILSCEATTTDGRLAFIADRDSLEAIGAKLMEGALGCLAKYWFIGLVILVLAGWALNRCVPVDSTDRARDERSGLRPRTDALTGCQYLETNDGALTPRLAADGRPMCGVAR